ncbi:hypothetical protein [Pediococcus stilesii]|uniref:hypothetical protein n=1 Tax=Pediococcus stilesii TaxID=331679 RepID=UPI00148725CA|nr:hypothetical protein [Pediococcus stilesii]
MSRKPAIKSYIEKKMKEIESNKIKRAEADAEIAQLKSDELQGKGELNLILVATAEEAKKLIPEEEDE